MGILIPEASGKHDRILGMAIVMMLSSEHVRSKLTYVTMIALSVICA